MRIGHATSASRDPSLAHRDHQRDATARPELPVKRTSHFALAVEGTLAVFVRAVNLQESRSPLQRHPKAKRFDPQPVDLVVVGPAGLEPATRPL
jgi:hypothetical protein